MFRYIFRAIPLILFSCTLFMVNNASAGKLYIWKDSKGVEHITEQPPPENIQPRETINHGQPQNNSPTPQYLESLQKDLNTVRTCIELSKESMLLGDESSELMKFHHEDMIQGYRAEKMGIRGPYKELEMDYKRQVGEINRRRGEIRIQKKLLGCE